MPSSRMVCTSRRRFSTSERNACTSECDTVDVEGIAEEVAQAVVLLVGRLPDEEPGCTTP